MFNNLIISFKNKISPGNNVNPVTLPEKLHINIKEYLKPDEDLLCCIKNHRAMYNTSKWNDKNTFFNSWCILTNRRLIIIRNLNYVKVFRDIDFAKIIDHKIEKSKDIVNIKIIGSGSEDTIEFSKHLVSYANKFSDKLTKMIVSYQCNQEINHNASIKINCFNCSNLIFKKDKFCPNCGAKQH